MTAADLAVNDATPMLRGRHVLLAVGGGIAAYKACELARLLVRSGAGVDVAMTRAAQRFVTPLTFQALTQRPVATDLLDASEEQQIGHIGLADRADLAIVAPCTADLGARLRAGAADDIVTTALLAVRAPVMLAPSMNVHMWRHPATVENFATLRARGLHQVGPGSGEMACGHVGDGRLAEPWEILRAAAGLLGVRDLAGKRVLVTAGPTREHLDPVRFVSNPSTGKMGYAIAREALRRGADVTLVSGPVSLPRIEGVRTLDVVSAEELAEAVLREGPDSELVFMAAAVSDQKPAVRHDQKVKKQPGPETLELVRTPDVLATLGALVEGRARRPLLVGFAAETERLVEHAREKLVRKRVDLVVANDVGPGGAFGSDENEVRLVWRDGERSVPRGSKDAVARVIVDEAVRRLASA